MNKWCFYQVMIFMSLNIVIQVAFPSASWKVKFPLLKNHELGTVTANIQLGQNHSLNE